jgi:DNA-entry nuclease
MKLNNFAGNNIMQPKENRKRNRNSGSLIFASVAIILIVFLCLLSSQFSENYRKAAASLDIPEYSGQAYAVINNNIPFFNDEDKQTNTFESYSDLDSLGRCQVAYANVSRELMPTKERGEIGNIKPSGWKQAEYEGLVDSSPPYLYNRCHLIAYCLTAENANEKNLITGTRYMNAEGMLPFEEQVAKYLDQYDNHVLYRVTPIFEGDNLVASGVLMEAYSVEDEGAGICFCVYCYNVQPGVYIDYRTGESRLEN